MSAIYRQQAQICQIYLKPTIRGITGWCGTPYVHADHFIGRREFPSHIHRPRTIPGRQIENPLWTSAEFMQNIPLKERLKRFVAMIDYMCVSATPLLAASVRGSKRTECSNPPSRLPCGTTKVSEEEWDTLRNSIRIRLHSTWRERGHPFPAEGETKVRSFPRANSFSLSGCGSPKYTKVYYSPAPSLEFVSGSLKYADAYASWGENS